MDWFKFMRNRGKSAKKPVTKIVEPGGAILTIAKTMVEPLEAIRVRRGYSTIAGIVHYALSIFFVLDERFEPGDQLIIRKPSGKELLLDLRLDAAPPASEALQENNILVFPDPNVDPGN